MPIAVPVRMGGGTRLKVLEGLAVGKPMVSTTLGCEGVRVRGGEHLLVADGADAFAAAIARLFEHPGLGHALGSAGRGLVEREQAPSGEQAEAAGSPPLGGEAGQFAVAPVGRDAPEVGLAQQGEGVLVRLEAEAGCVAGRADRPGRVVGEGGVVEDPQDSRSDVGSAVGGIEDLVRLPQADGDRVHDVRLRAQAHEC